MKRISILMLVRSGTRLLLLALFLAMVPAAFAHATWYVDGVNGSDNNDCKSPQTACKTIGHAISLASKRDSIMVAAATYTENLAIGFSLNVIGSGAMTTIIDGGRNGTVVKISSANSHVTLSNVTIQNGQGGFGIGGGINNSGTLTISSGTVSDNGGGINNSGTLTISSSTVSGNAARGIGGISNNGGTLTINKSTISGNSAGGPPRGVSDGGGIYNYRGTVTINNSTLSGNFASGSGGGIANDGTLTISNSTLSGNGAMYYGGGINNEGGTATLQNSIVANNSGGSCAGTITSDGYNLSSDETCNFNNTGDLNNTKPLLGRLKNNGGPTKTHALLQGSPAIDAGNPNGCTDGNGHLLKTDQRGYPRPDKEDHGIGCDMGAFERQSD